MVLCWLPTHVLQPCLYRMRIILPFLALVLPQHDGPHHPSWRASSRKEFELCEALFGQDVETVECHPPAVGEGAHLPEKWCDERFVGQLLSDLVKPILGRGDLYVAWKLVLVDLTSTTTPPVGLSSHCVGISKFGAGCPPILCAGMQETMMVGCLYFAGQGSCSDSMT